MVERLIRNQKVSITDPAPAGAAGKFSSPRSTVCVEFYFGIRYNRGGVEAFISAYVMRYELGQQINCCVIYLAIAKVRQNSVYFVYLSFFSFLT